MSARTSTLDRREFDARTDESELIERCSALAERATARGADEAEAYGARTRTIKVSFEKGDLKLAHLDEGTSLGLRVFRERRMGFASTNQEGVSELDSAAADALSIAAAAPPHEANVLQAARAITPLQSLVDPRTAAVTIEQAVAHGRDLVRRAREFDPRLSIDNASCTVSSATHAIHTTRGVHAAESDAQISLSIMGMAIDGHDVGGFHFAGDLVRDPTQVERALRSVLAEFCATTVGNLNAQDGESYRGPVLFAPDAFIDLFIAPILSAASAVAVQRGRSALIGKLETAIATPLLSIVDDPTDRTLAGAGSFDREGQPCGRFAIVERGVLASWLYNGYAAAVEGRTSTGHALGGPRGVPGLGAHALTVAPGNGGTRDEMCARLGRGLLVQRFSGTVDPASGDFSGVAKSSRWIEGGRPVRAVRETLLSGNALELLTKILALSSAAERCSGEALAPWALVDGLSVTAGSSP